MLSPDELMKPRYKVIADYPNSIYKIGEIITIHMDYDNRLFCRENSPTYSDYPGLFKPLEWWEERGENDMPEYVKFMGTTYNAKWINHLGVRPKDIIDISNNDLSVYWHFGKDEFLPATLEEYQSQSK